MRVTGIDHVQLLHARRPGRHRTRVLCAHARHPGSPEAAGARQARRRVVRGSGAVKIHLGVEADFRPARKAHPALVVDDLGTLVATLRSKGHEVVPADGVAGCSRVHVSIRSATGSS